MLKDRTVILICMALAVVTYAVYWQVLDHDFVNFDDPHYVYENPVVKKGLTIEGIGWAFSSFHRSNWHPLTWISHMADVQLFGLNAGKHLFVNLFFHTVNSIVLFLLLFRMTGGLWQSAFVAALFALHPLHVESAAWVSERKDVLSTFFWLATMWAYAVYAERPNIVRYTAVVVLFILGLMAKPMLVTLPFVLLLMDFWPLQRLNAFLPEKKAAKSVKSPLALVIEKAPLFVLVIVSCVVTYMAQNYGGAVRSFDQMSLGIRVSNALVSYVVYIFKMVWPHPLAVYYPHPASLPLWQILGAGLILAAVTIFLFYRARKLPFALVGWLWFLGTLVPVIGLVQVGGQALADRYTYIPSIGLFMAIAWGAPLLLSRFPKQKLVAAIAAGAVLIVFAVLTYNQVGYWKNGFTLFYHAAEKTDGNWLANFNVGNAYLRSKRYNEAAERYKLTLKFKPDHIKAHINLGMAMLRQGKEEEAVRLFKAALKLDKNSAEAHGNLGIVYAQKGRLDEAESHFREAVRLEPDNGKAYANLGSLLWSQGSREEALEFFIKGVRLAPGDANTRNNLGNALWAMDRLEEAKEQFTEALRINPGHGQARRNLINLKKQLEY